MHSKENKEKYEGITRKMLTEFIPKYNYPLFLAEKYIKDKENNRATRESANDISAKFESIYDFYNNEIKNYYPLEMHSKITDLISQTTWLFVNVGIDDNEHNSSNIKISQAIEKCDELIKDITKHIEKNYI